MFGTEVKGMKRRAMTSFFAMVTMTMLLVSCGGGGGSAGAAGSPGVDGESIHWLGSFASAPADPEQYDAYFNTADGNSYIYSGTTWDILASRGGNGTNGVTINWCGQLASAPVGANMYDAYFNTADGNSYIFNGTSWEILAQHGTNGIDGEDINWRGELGSAPSSPTVFDAYYNTGDGNSYIYTGSGWQILAHSGSNGIDGVTINWLGEFASAPTSVLENDAYYNTADGTSYIYNGTSWDHLALRGAMGPQGPTGNNGISIQWLGSFDAHPSSPSINQAYYNTADGKSYIYTGSGWQVLAQDGTDGTNGTNGISVHWLGEYDSAPPSPAINDAYYNNLTKISYIWTGSWSVLCKDGASGAQGAPGTPIVWKGTFASAPSNPEMNWAYYDSTVRKSFVYDGDSWEIMCQDGTSIVWLGSFASAPSNPALNNAYYNTALKKSYIWDGDSWEIMCQDGTAGISWIDVTDTTIQAEPNRGYVADSASQVTITLPTSPSIGDIVRVTGAGTGGWKIAQNDGQRIVHDELILTTSIGSIWLQGSTVASAWEDIDVSSDGTKIIASSNTGVWTSSDSGVTFIQRLGFPCFAVASSADGSKLVAANISGQICVSNNFGISWTYYGPSGSVRSVDSSEDGTKLVAVQSGGYIWTSTDSGVNWTQRGSSGSWFGVASSSDGSKLVAVQNGGYIWTSTDSGISWTQQTTSTATWRCVASSSDGTKLVAVQWGGYICTSTDSGVNWTQRGSNGMWLSVASSSDGSKLVAVQNGGNIWTSTDSGVNWVQRAFGGNWWCVASSADGSILYAGDAANNLIYYSIPSMVTSTTVGTTGTLIGDQYESVELQYAGNNTFTVISSEGEFFVY